MTQNGKKKILILTADAGFGHRSAANAVAAALEEKYKDKCEFEIVNPLEHKSTPFFLRESQSDYDSIVRNMPELYQLGYDASDASFPSAIVESALTVFLYEAMRETIKKYQPDAILTTYPLYQMPLMAVFIINDRYVPLINVITDLATVHRLWFYKNIDLCLVPTEMVKKLALDYGISDSKIRVTGIPVHPGFSKYSGRKRELREELGWEPELTTYLAVGSKRVDNLYELLQVINHFGAPLQLVVVTGKDEELYKQLNEVEWHHPTQIYGFVEDMPKLMNASDVILAKAGGLIVTESLASGMPMILVDVIQGQETGNARFVTENGAGELAQTQIELLEVLAHLTINDGELRKKYAENARKIGKPLAAYAIADYLWEAAKVGPIERSSKNTGRPNLVDLLTRNKIRWQENPFKFEKDSK